LSTAPNAPAVPDGNKGFEIKARTASPLGFVVVLELLVPVVAEEVETLPLQETKSRLTTRRTTQASAILFKTRDSEEHEGQRFGCKTPDYSRAWTGDFLGVAEPATQDTKQAFILYPHRTCQRI
jgi:hypothetical protein